MLCPVDQTPLIMSDRQGVEIDYCPKCRGIWLDRGELDKILERSGAGTPRSSDSRNAQRSSPSHDRGAHPHEEDYAPHRHRGARGYEGYGHHGTPYEHRRHDYKYKKKSKKKSGMFGDFLEEIFDF